LITAISKLPTRQLISPRTSSPPHWFSELPTRQLTTGGG